jgi:hypothetical protein
MLTPLEAQRILDAEARGEVSWSWLSYVDPETGHGCPALHAAGWTPGEDWRRIEDAVHERLLALAALARELYGNWHDGLPRLYAPESRAATVTALRRIVEGNAT